MSTFRAVVRLVAMFFVTVGMFWLWWLGSLFVGANSARGLAWRRRHMRRWSRAMIGFMGARVELIGQAPPAPCIMVSNHLGYVDIAVLGSCADTVFVSKSEVRSWPLIGRGVAAIGTIFIDRKSSRAIPLVNEQIHAALASNDRVLFFPEGTSTDGTGILPFKSSLLEPAAQSGYPVFCVAVRYSTSPGAPHASRSVCWWGDMPFTEHLLGLLRLSHFRAQVVFHSEPQLGEGRKVLAERTERVVAGLLQRLIES